MAVFSLNISEGIVVVSHIKGYFVGLISILLTTSKGRGTWVLEVCWGGFFMWGKGGILHSLKMVYHHFLRNPEGSNANAGCAILMLQVHRELVEFSECDAPQLLLFQDL